MKKEKLLWWLAAALALAGTVLRGFAGMRFSAALFWCAALAAAVYALLAHYAPVNRAARRGKRIFLVLLAAGFAFFAALEVQILRDAHSDGPASVSCAVILGAGVNGTEPSAILRSRLDAALVYLADKPELPVIVSGGQGSGEDITEAECMARYLVGHGVDAARIVREEKSTSTEENLLFSADVRRALGLDEAAAYAVVTSDFHLHRVRRYSGGQAVCVAARLPDNAYFSVLTANYYVREAFALAKTLVFGGF